MLISCGLWKKRELKCLHCNAKASRINHQRKGSGGKSLLLPAKRISYLDNIVILSTDALYTVPKTLIDLYDETKQHWTNLDCASTCYPFDAFNELAGLEKPAALDEQNSTVLIFKQRDRR